MSTIAVLLAVVYLGVLAFTARTAERLSKTPLWVRVQPWLPGIALGVYCTTWTYYGAVGRAVSSGFAYVPIYLGPILLYVFAFPVLRRVHQRSKEQSSGSIADLLALRYGRRRTVAVIATLIAVGASLPYIGLQLRAVATSLDVLSRGTGQSQSVELMLAIALGSFAGIFGTRTRETTDPRPGLVAAVALESVIKLLALGAVAFFVLGSFELPSIAETLDARGSADEPSFWVITVLSAFAVLCLPRQFHMLAVETQRAEDLERSRWIFPGYLLLMSAFVAPVAAFGIIGDSVGHPDALVLSIPLDAGQNALALFAFIGGFSAATAMVIVSGYAVGSMVTNELIVPSFLNLPATLRDNQGQRLSVTVVLMRRFAILGVVLTAYVYLSVQSRTTALASFGLEAFSLIAQLAPALLLGLYWRRAHAYGAIAGMVVGAALWGYFSLLPLVGPELAQGAELYAEILGLGALDVISRGTVISVVANTATLVLVSAWVRPRLVDRAQAAAFIHGSGEDRYGVWEGGSGVKVGDLHRLLEMFLDDAQRERLIQLHERRVGGLLLDDDEAPGWMVKDTERALAAVLGVASARDLLLSLGQQRRLEIDEVFQIVGGTAEALRFNRNLLYTSLENSAIGISVIDSGMKLVAWNQRYIELFAYPPGVVTVGRPIEHLLRFNLERSGIDPVEAEVKLEKRLEHLRVGTPYTTQSQIHGRVLEVNGRPLPEGGFVTTFSDITDLVSAQDALQRANETLEEKIAERTAQVVQINEALADAKTAAERANQEKTHFLVAAGHDILQPLGAARLFLTAALESLDRARRDELLSKLGDSLGAAEDLIADLYEISKLDHGALKPELSEVPVSEILEQLVEETRPIAESKGLELRYVPSDAYTRCDPRYLRRIVGNFLSNAIKYTARGKVLVGVRLAEETLRVQVLDTGPGIPDSERGRVFDDFYRLDEARREAGSGLGLSVVRRMAGALGSHVELSSVVGRGSCFSIELPRLRVQRSRPVLLTEPTAWSADSVRVMYLDDERANLDALGALVQNWGCEIESFEHVAAAVRFANAHSPPAILIVDYQLEEDSDGVSVAKTLHERWGRPVPTLIVTALRDNQVRARAVDAGFMFLHKPLKPAALRSTLRHMLSTGAGYSRKSLDASSTA